jgi:alkanesulfonate monooxygenase SsuD/methylene tetrahydromethanopterin reductase-like flavin-dependent oxidoreductase (luciferase family)
MITKFDSSYYGTADMEDLGYTGTPINERRYSKEQLAGALHKVVKYAKCMDERGFNTFWMAEHHFQRPVARRWRYTPASRRRSTGRWRSTTLAAYS